MVNKIKICFLFVCLIFISCENNSFSFLFSKLVDLNDSEILYSYNTYNEENKNKYYKKIYKQGKKNNENLIEKALSVKETNWIAVMYPINLTEGDIAISLLLDINSINDTDFLKLMPRELVSSYKNSGTIVWWNWIHESINNRVYVVEQLKDELKILKAVL